VIALSLSRCKPFLTVPSFFPNKSKGAVHVTVLACQHTEEAINKLVAVMRGAAGHCRADDRRADRDRGR
jgi:hypothetical protein